MTRLVTAWRTEENDAGQRLDAHIAQRLDRPRSQVQKWIKAGHVTVACDVGARKSKPSTVIEPGFEITCELPEPQVDAELVPEAGEIDVLFVDEHLVIVNKPSGLAVHPGAGQPDGTLVNRLLHHYPEIGKLGGRGRPGIVHRLDQGTTGALIVARSEPAQRRLQQAFADRTIDKTYLAITHGQPSPTEGLIEAPIGRHSQDRKRMTVRGDGRPARTGYRVLEAIDKVASTLELDLHTGRTHQIRVHLKHLGHPLIGDPVYGEARWRGAPKSKQKALADFPRPALHAWKLAFQHPISDQPLEITAPIPDDLSKLWRALGGRDLEAEAPV